MNVVQEINRINAKELELNSTGSWHDQYKDSAYIYVGGLPNQLTEGDVITIFSQYGEVVDISLPRDAATQKTKGFAFLMYADQRSTILAVDNLGGSKVLERTLRVDHVLNYKQLERDKESGKMVERDIQSLAAHPDKFKSSNIAEPGSPTYSSSSHGSIDPEDPMRDFLIQERKAAKLLGGSKEKKRSRKEGEESKEERRERRDKKKRSKELKEDSRRARDRDSSSKGKGREDSSSNRRDGRAIESRRDDRDRDDRRDNGNSRRNYNEDDRRDSRRRDEDDRDQSRRSGGGRDDYNSSRSSGGGDRDRRDDRGSDRRDDGKDSKTSSSKNSFADLEKWARGS